MQGIEKSINRVEGVYRLFAEELEAHLAFFKEVRAREEALGAKKSVSELRVMSEKLHLIKGGAGFLKLEEIRLLADNGEKWFKGFEGVPDPAELRERLNNLISGFCDELVKLKSLLQINE